MKGNCTHCEKRLTGKQKKYCSRNCYNLLSQSRRFRIVRELEIMANAWLNGELEDEKAITEMVKIINKNK